MSRPLAWALLPAGADRAGRRRLPRERPAAPVLGRRAAGRGAHRRAHRARRRRHRAAGARRRHGADPIAQVQVDGAYWAFTQDPPGPLPRLGHGLAAHPLPLGARRDAPHRAAQPRRGAVRAHDRRGGGDADPRQPERTRASSACSSASCRWRSACCSTRRSRPAAASAFELRAGADGRAAAVPARRYAGGGVGAGGRGGARLPRRGHGLAGRRDDRGLLSAVGRRGGGKLGGLASPPRSRSASACTISARGWRSARPSRPVRRRSAPSWSSASRCTTSPRASASWRPWSRRGTGCRSSRRSRHSPACRPSPASGSAATPSRRIGRRWPWPWGPVRSSRSWSRWACCSLRRARSQGGRGDGARDAAGLVAGIVVMYATALLVQA